MRVSTAFNRILRVPGAWVDQVEFNPTGIVVGVRRRFRRLTCPCGWSTTVCHQGSIRRWRHLDMGGTKLFIQAEIRRLRCRRCRRVRTEQVPWARAGARHTRDFEDVVCWLAQRTDKTSVQRLMRCSWATVDAIVKRVVADSIDIARLDDVYRIGVDEISYRRHHRYITLIADHDHGGGVVWAAEGRSAKVMDSFFADLGPDRSHQLRAVSMDMSNTYAASVRRHAPQAAVCIDPFHVIKLANQALDAIRRWAARITPPADRKMVRGLRWSLLSGDQKLTARQRALLDQLRRQRHILWRAWNLKEELRGLYQLTDPTTARAYLTAWLRRASRSRIPAMINLARTIRHHYDGIIAAVELQLSNGRLEGLNSKIRLINHRGYGHHSAAAIIAMIYLCCGAVTVTLPLH